MRRATTIWCGFATLVWAAAASAQVPRFDLTPASLELSRAVRPNVFFDVVGRRAAVFGYEDRSFEAWVYPLKVLDAFSLAFGVEGLPEEIAGRDAISRISVRPEATILVYSHAAFTAREVIFAPLDEPGIVVLLDVESTLPMRVTASFLPHLDPMWPEGRKAANAAFDARSGRYSIVDRTGRLAAVVGSPGARDLTLRPHQKQPRDLPLRFVREISQREARETRMAIVIAGSTTGRADAEAAYERLLSAAPALYAETARAYRDLLDRTTDVEVPDDRLTRALRWGKVGLDKGLARNPALGMGLLAGFGTSGESQRPGYAWFFGRDALWTALATNAEGDFATTRAALEFLAEHQRADGKIPHEISQSAGLVSGGDADRYLWASADSTALFVVAHADYFMATGDRAFLARHWKSIVKAFRFVAATDTDGNHLVENTNFGHGWVEGGALYPSHEEIYLQGVWMAAARGLADLADAMGDAALSREARARAESTRRACEQRFWLADRGYYAFATADAGERLVSEDTVLPAVPLWWGLLEPSRADSQIDHLGAGDVATDWGARILSSKSKRYYPLAYHHGSVWPLFTGWTAMAAYRYGRPHVGYQALMANALLTEQGALGYITELLSGAFNAPLGHASPHQIWSEAMVVTPIIRGLLGVEVSEGGSVLSLRPQLPADWSTVVVRRIAVGERRFDATLSRGSGAFAIDLAAREADAASGRLRRLVVAPAFPLDARLGEVRVNGRAVRPTVTPVGDVQFAEVRIEAPPARTRVEFSVTGGSDAYVRREVPRAGETSQEIRILRSRASADGLRLTLEGRGGRTYTLGLRSPGRDTAGTDAPGVKLTRAVGRDPEAQITFEGPQEEYVRREVLIRFSDR